MAAPGPFRRNMTLLWAGQFVSSTGDALFLLAVSWIARGLGGGALETGLAVFLATLPFLLFALPAGAWVDRGDRRRILIASDLARAAVLLALPWVAQLQGGLSYGLLVGAAFLVSTFSTPFNPARDALLPRLAAGRSLARWNAFVQTSWQVAQILGLCLGALLLTGEARGGGDDVARVLAVLQFDGATFLVSALALAFLVLPPRPAVRPTHGFVREVVSGAREALRDKGLGALLLLTALNNLALMGPATVGPTLLLRDELGLGVGHLALFEGMMATGMLLGAGWIAWRGRRFAPRSLLLWGLVLDGLSYLPFLWIPSYPLFLAGILVHGMFIPLIVVGRTSLVQHHVPDRRRGQVFALVGLTMSGMTALSALSAGAIAAWTGPRGLFGIAGAFGALTGLLGFALLRGRFAARAA